MKLSIPRVVIAGLRGGSGKTTLSLGLTASLRQRNLRVLTFKKGPDYIDAGWLASAATTPCYNLDTYMMDEQTVKASFLRKSREFAFADLEDSNGDESSSAKAGGKAASRTAPEDFYTIIEGNRGLHDGMDEKGTASTAHLARALRAPVIVILDCTKMTRTAAAMVLGARMLDEKVELAGVVLNHLGGARHEQVVRKSIEKYTDVPVVGALPRMRSEIFPERHMGLTPFQEHPEVQRAIESVGNLIDEHVDTARIFEIARGSAPLEGKPEDPPTLTPLKPRVSIGIVRDSAFQFYYPENFEELERHGADLVEISAITDRKLPDDLDALYIGGGFPETHTLALAQNRSFRESLKSAIEADLPVYAECGGLMYLGRSIRAGDRIHDMAGVFPIDFTLGPKPAAHGYTEVEVAAANPYYKKGLVLRGHEFHYSRPSDLDREAAKDVSFAFRMKRGRGMEDGMDGLSYKNVFATYTHLHALGSPEWVQGMMRLARRFRKARQAKKK